MDELRQRRAREVTILVVDRLGPGAIHRAQFSPEQVQFAAEQHKLSEYQAKDVAVVGVKISDGLEVGLQMMQQLDYFDVAVGFGLQPAACPHPIEVGVGVDVELQTVRGAVARTTGRFGRQASENGRHQVQPINEGVDKPHRIVTADMSSTASGKSRVWDRSWLAI